MTEKSSIERASRESVTWWKTLMQILCENHSRAAMPNENHFESITVNEVNSRVSIDVYLR